MAVFVPQANQTSTTPHAKPVSSAASLRKNPNPNPNPSEVACEEDRTTVSSPTSAVYQNNAHCCTPALNMGEKRKRASGLDKPRKTPSGTVSVTWPQLKDELHPVIGRHDFFVQRHQT